MIIVVLKSILNKAKPLVNLIMKEKDRCLTTTE